MRGITMAALALGALTMAAHAQDGSKPTASTASTATTAAKTAPQRGEGFGADTRYWTSLQVSGAAATRDERPLPGEVATKIYERYVQSFTHPIPERFSRDSFSSGGGGGGGSGGGTP